MGSSLDITGQKYGNLTAINLFKSGTKSGNRKWLCKCDCGKITIVSIGDIRNGHTTSCGCKSSRNMFGEISTKHGHSRVGKRTSEYNCWKGIWARCNNKNDKSYINYGGRGIKVCKKWRKFENFLEDMGMKPSDAHSIDRINNNGDYKPSNCRWATRLQQARNSRKNKMLTIDGERMTLSMAAEKYKVDKDLLSYRLIHGWNLMDALRPPRKIKI